MFSRVLVAASLTVLSLPAYCQSPPAKQATTVPDYILYDHFMLRVVWLETQANNLKAQGKDDTFLRSYIKLQAGLTTSEESSLKSISADSQAQTTAIMNSAKALVAAGAIPATSQQVQALLSQRQQIVVNHMSQLQAAFGSARYAVLDAYVRQNVKLGASVSIPAGIAPKSQPVSGSGK